MIVHVEACVNISAVQKKLLKKYGDTVSARFENKSIVVSGMLDSWEAIIDACRMCVVRQKQPRAVHVVNNISLRGVQFPRMKTPPFFDNALDGQTPDVLVIGAGISGASIARELTKWKLNVLLVDKEADVALHASGRNDGEVHPGVDLRKGSLKQHYVLRGNAMYERVCNELSVPFKRCGQYVGFFERAAFVPALLYVLHRKYLCGVRDTKLISGKAFHNAEPYADARIKFAMYNPSAGCVCPYGLTIAYAENAAANGARISLQTAVLGMEVVDGIIMSVVTNRGTVRPKIVINAAGTFADDVAQMACDKFFSIHARRGTNSILDKKSGKFINAITSWKALKNTAYTKGGGLLHTVHGNVLVGPDAVETYEKENFATTQESIDTVFARQSRISKNVSTSAIITYFTGVRAATFEEDFIIERGRSTRNIIHCAGIQSPGLTTAPAVALDIEAMAVAMLRENGNTVEKNSSFNPCRNAIPVLREMSDEERDKKIKENPDYGIIVCRCEEVSKGEIIDALRSPLGVATVDAVKKRVRPGMGRCQGGFCMPLVAQIISEELHVPLAAVRKCDIDSVITFGSAKENAASCSAKNGVYDSCVAFDNGTAFDNLALSDDCTASGGRQNDKATVGGAVL